MKRTHALALVLLAGALACVLWLVLRARRGELASRTAAERTAQPADDSLDLVAEPTARALEPAVAATVESAAPPLAPANEAAPDGFALRVLRYDTGEPVARARVFVLALATREAESKLYATPLHTLADAKESGIRHEADGDGRFTLPRSERRSLVFVETDELAGFVHLGARPEIPSEVFVHEDRALRVRVIDEGGAPRAAVELALSCRGSDRFYGDVATTKTGPDGAVAIEHAGLMCASVDTLAVRVRAPSDPPIEAIVDASTLAKGEAVLVMPATGEVEILVQDALGAPWPEPASVAVFVDRLDRGSSSARHDEWTSYPVEQGRVVISDIPLGGYVHASAKISEADRDSLRGRTKAPTHAGERVTLVLANHEQRLALSIEGRLVDERGPPIARAMAAVAHGSPFRLRNTSDLHVDEHGRFRWRPWFAANIRGSAHIYAYTRAENEPGIDRFARVDVAAMPRRGTLDLGDIVLRVPPPLCSGRVVDANGAAIAGAELRLQANGTVIGLPPPLLCARSDAEGRFLIRGVIECEQVQVIASADGFGAALVPLDANGGELTIVLTTATRIAGSIAPSRHFRMDEVMLTCDPLAGSGMRVFSSRTSPAHGSGAFAFTGLGVDVFRVHAEVRPMVGKPVVLGDVETRAGETTRDAKLQKVDLDARLHVFELSVRDTDGRDVPRFWIAARSADDRDAPFQSLDDGHRGRVRLTSTHAQIEVAVSAPGTRGVLAVCSEGPTAFVLAPGIEIELVCKESTELREHGVTLVPLLELQGTLEFFENDDGVAFDELGVCRLTIAHAGAYDVGLKLRPIGASTWQGKDVAPRSKIEVLDSVPAQRFEIALPPEALEKALGELRK